MSLEIPPAEIIGRYFAGTEDLVLSKTYHSILPIDLVPWYCYITGCGHSVLELVEGQFDEENPRSWPDYLCPCPVKSVMREYRLVNGYAVVPLKYDSVDGLITDPDDEEF